MLANSVWLNRVDVPCHVKEELQIVGCHLWVVDVDNPQLTAVVVIGCFHLRIRQAGLVRGQPHIVVRTPPVRQMIVDAATPAAFLLFGIREPCHVAVVVVAPHQCHVIGYLQSALHNL